MPINLFESPEQRNILLDELELGHAVQANQHLIVRGDEGLLLDPGGPKTFRHIYPSMLAQLKRAKLTHIFMSHQDPDIVAAVNPWLTTTNARAYMSALWVRFVPHFGLDKLMAESCVTIPDEGGILRLAGSDLLVLPAHFLHSPGNFHIYDPVSKILYSGDLGASLGQDYVWVEDFDKHLAYMTGFHRRYMSGTKATQRWAAMARQLDIEIIAPQHGSLFRGKAMCQRFIDWIDGFECGVDLLPEYKLPTKHVG
ncbi:MAG: MBL fold metallo-hydrolase [Myxococcota bacterium]